MICLVAYWPLTFYLYSLKNDALTYFLPTRHQISEAIYHGYWPFWSPYFNLGYPIHGDMQAGVWNPIVQLFSLTGPYTLRMLQYETLLYIYLSGVGMFFLINYFNKDQRTGLLIGTAFMLCGYISDSAQFLNWIASAAFLPFIFLFFYKTITEYSWKSALLTGIFFYLLFTAGYPASFILTSYLLLAMLLFHIWQKDNLNRKTLLTLFKLLCVFSSSFILLSLPPILSFSQFLLLTQRGSGATYTEAMSNPLHPWLLISYITPLAVWKASFATVTDGLQRNSYIGLVTFSFVLMAFLIRSKSRVVSFWKWAFILSLIFSLGEIGGLRILTYYLLPLMNSFRHPANARLFTSFFGCLLAAFIFQKAISHTLSYRVRKYAWLLLLLTFCIATTIAFFSEGSHFTIKNFSLNTAVIKAFLDHLTFRDFLVFNLLIQIPFLIFIYLFIIRKIQINLLVAASITNCIITTMLTQPLQVVKKDHADHIQQILNKVQVKGYPFPDLSSTLLSNSLDGGRYFNEIACGNMYNKKIGRIDYFITPSNLYNQVKFWSNPIWRDRLFKYPFFYRVDSAVFISDTSKRINTKKHLALIANKNLPDTINRYPSQAFQAAVKKFNPNELEIDIHTTDRGFYTVFQNYHPSWSLYIDGHKQQLYLCNISFMGFWIDPGKHTIGLKYEPAGIKAAFYISILTLLGILLLLLKKSR